MISAKQFRSRQEDSVCQTLAEDNFLAELEELLLNLPPQNTPKITLTKEEIKTLFGLGYWDIAISKSVVGAMREKGYEYDCPRQDLIYISWEEDKEHTDDWEYEDFEREIEDDVDYFKD